MKWDDHGMVATETQAVQQREQVDGIIKVVGRNCNWSDEKCTGSKWMAQRRESRAVGDDYDIDN